METAETCPMCRLDISESVTKKKRPWDEYESSSQMKNMNGKMISEQQIHWIRDVCNVSRGLAIRGLQWTLDGEEEDAADYCNSEKEWMIEQPLTPERKWNEPDDEMEAFWGLHWLFREEKDDVNLTVRHLKMRHNFSGFYNWKNHEWDGSIVVDDKYKTIH